MCVLQLNLQGLNHLDLDPSVVASSTKTIMAHLKLRSTNMVPNYRMKIVVVGGAEKGKTSLINKIIKASSSHSAKKSTLNTVGVAIKPWVYQQKQPDGNAVTYNLNCWDFVGLKEFYPTYQCFFSDRSVYIVRALLHTKFCNYFCIIPFLYRWFMTLVLEKKKFLV